MSFTFCTHTGTHQIKLLCISIKWICHNLTGHCPYEQPFNSFSCALPPDGIVGKNANNSRVFPQSDTQSCFIQSQPTTELNQLLTFQTEQTLRRVPLPTRLKRQSPMDRCILREISLFYRTFQEESGQCHGSFPAASCPTHLALINSWLTRGFKRIFWGGRCRRWDWYELTAKLGPQT